MKFLFYLRSGRICQLHNLVEFIFMEKIIHEGEIFIELGWKQH